MISAPYPQLNLGKSLRKAASLGAAAAEPATADIADNTYSEAIGFGGISMDVEVVPKGAVTGTVVIWISTEPTFAAPRAHSESPISITTSDAGEPVRFGLQPEAAYVAFENQLGDGCTITVFRIPPR